MKRIGIISVVGLLISTSGALGVGAEGSVRKYVPVKPCEKPGEQCALRMDCKPGEMCAQIVLEGVCDGSLSCKQSGETCNANPNPTSAAYVKGKVVREGGKLVCKPMPGVAATMRTRRMPARKKYPKSMEGKSCIYSPPLTSLVAKGKVVCKNGDCECMISGN